jgi:hypothetical protein
MTPIMRIVITVAHFYRASSQSRLRSELSDPRPRANALARCLAGIHQSLGTRQAMLGFDSSNCSGGEPHQIDVLLVTTAGCHLIEFLPRSLEVTPVPVDCAPHRLGYECHRLLRDRIGHYDVYGYMEDDLLVSDSFFLEKILWFGKVFGPGSVLLPNRFELAAGRPVYKLYIDGRLARRAVAERDRFRVAPARRLKAPYLSGEVHFDTAQNPHSGCFFLSREQMRRWASQPWFLDYSDAFWGPLESAATLGILRTFEIFKPGSRNPGFLELQHLDARHLRPPETTGERRAAATAPIG